MMSASEDAYPLDLFEDEFDDTPDDELLRHMPREQVDDMLRRLANRERQVLQMRCGLVDGRQPTLEEASIEFDIMAERIRLIELRVLGKLWHVQHGSSRFKSHLS